jgi:hypothetical protein
VEIELLKLIPGGGACIAVIAVVLIFLKAQREDRIESAKQSQHFIDEVRIITRSYQDNVNSIMANVAVNQRTFQDQIKEITDDHMKLTRETITAVKGLEGAVRELQQSSKYQTSRPPT